MKSKLPPAVSARLAQAKLFAEVARRVEKPFDSLPDGDVSRVAIVLWQEAAAWAISATQALEPPADAGEAATAARALLERAAGGSEMLTTLVTMIPSEPSPKGLAPAASSARANTLAGFSEALIAELERPVRDAHKALGRKARLALLGIVVVAAVCALVIRLLRPDLVPSAVRTLSSSYSTCEQGKCGTATFHTTQQLSPWVRYDFKSPKNLHSIDVENRTDCCFERALPLVVESSNDGKSWTELARVRRDFLNWSASLKGQARYVRLRVDGNSILHLRSVTIR